MKRMLLFFCLSSCTCLLLTTCQNGAEQVITQGMHLTQSLTVEAKNYYFPASHNLDEPILSVEGENLILDFSGATLDSGMDPTQPQQFMGLGLMVKGGRQITIKNLNIKGYKIALMAENVDSLQIINCDFSYNYRPKLYSQWDREDFSDWLSYHQNDQDEWQRYGAGVYLKNCDHARLSELKVSQGQNGILMTNCRNGLFYNNTIQFNSGVGMGLYRSSGNRIMHNKLDWNVRGYSHNKYQRGQDSAGILCYEQSHENTFAYNSATHSGDGFFLWAGQSTMDTGKGGCNDNLIYANDFSQAPTNGVEITFSRNTVANNTIEECRYGIWGGYSYDSKISGNQIMNCEVGLAIEQGQDNLIERNRFHNTETGIQLWERSEQPAGWGYAQAREVDSRGYRIKENLFSKVENPLSISATDTVEAKGNIFLNYKSLLTTKQPNSNFVLTDNQVYGKGDWGDAAVYQRNNERLQDLAVDTNHILLGAYGYMPPPLMDGIDAILPDEHPRGRQYILMNEWGPYNFAYPSVWLREIIDDTYVFLLMGPAGNWKAVGGEGLAKINPKTGTFPTTFKAEKIPGSEVLSIQFEFIGEGFVDQFGTVFEKGQVYPFSFERYEKEMEWEVKWYAYTAASDPIDHYPAFRDLYKKPALVTEMTKGLVYHWWNSPAPGLPADQFATFAAATVELDPGQYQITISSDDGLRFYVDGELALDHWDAHESTTKEINLSLGGKHQFLVEHYDRKGLSAIDFRLTPIRSITEEETD